MERGGGGGGEMKKKKREREYYSLHKEPIGCISTPGAESEFLAHNIREQRVYQKSDPGGNMIIFVAYVRHVFRYLSSSSLTTGA